METPPPSFFEGLEKYYSNDLEDAKKSLGSADDIYSKALMILVDVKLDNGEHDKEIQERIDAMDFKGNDIALMFCVLAQEYSLHMTGAKNLILKRFDKPITVIKGEDSESASASEPDSEPASSSDPDSASASASASEEGESETKPPANNAKNANKPTPSAAPEATNANNPAPEANKKPAPEAKNANNPAPSAAPEAKNANTPAPEANKPVPKAINVPEANKVNTSTPTKPQVGGKRKTRRAKPSPSSEKEKKKQKKRT